MTVYKLPECTVTDSLPEGCAVALGNFDGVHLGHQSLFKKANQMKKDGVCKSSAVWTFADLAKPSENAPCLTDMKAKLALFAELDLDYAVFEDFSAVREITYGDFVARCLVDELQVGGVVCGFNFRFGKGGEGNAEILSELLSEHSIPLEIVPAVSADDGTVISSSCIRSLVQAGDMERAGELLGHPFSVSFPVVHGHQLGRAMGIPTINQSFPGDHISPARGIYACSCFVDGDIYLAVSNVGVRPTVSDGTTLNCETHIINYAGDLYGREVKVEFYCRLREEMKFDSVDALRRQIKIDISATLDYFSEKYGE